MSRWARDRLPIVVGLILVVTAAVWTGWIYRLPPAERDDALGFWGFVLGLAGVLVPLLAWLGRGRQADSRPVDTLTELLAQAVYGQWRKAADERRLVTPTPIPVRWSLSTLDVVGPVAAAIGTPDAPPSFRPLPGHRTSLETDLRAGGGRHELHALYSGLASGRIVVVGAPGSGKSGAAILLLLDALEHRDRLDGPQRVRCPVPVLFTTHGWDPTTTSVVDWLVTRLVADYPLFGPRTGAAEAHALLAARDKVALILDGLDEMDEALRPAALQALSDAPFRVVVLTRSSELVHAAARGWLVGAVAVHLHGVTAPDAADYLQRARISPPPTGWTDLLTRLRTHPDGVLAQGLATPLTLTLLRDTYQPGDDVGELLDNHYRSIEAVEQHLVARVLPAAYSPRAGRPPPRYQLGQAQLVLSFLARQMNQDHTRDLAWWCIPRWAPATPRMLATGLVFGSGFGLVAGAVVGLVGGLVFGLTGGFSVGLLIGPGGGEPQRVKIGSWGAVLSRRVLGRGLAGVFVFSLIGGFAGWLAANPAAGLIVGLAVGLAFGLAGGLVEDGADEASPLGPRKIWHNDQAAGLTVAFSFGLVGVLAGWTAGALTGELTTGLAFGFGGGLVGGLAVGLVDRLTDRFAVGLTASQSWPTMLAWLQLQISGRVPVVRLMPFLEDARERDVLRTVGAVYQFRHATLQDQLTSQAASPSTPFSAVSPTS